MLIGLIVFLMFLGFKFVTHGVGPMGIMQDDGYAVVGGLLILASGITIGYLVSAKEWWSKNEKSKHE